MTYVKCNIADGIARITMDDGKVNAISLKMLEHLNKALDQAETAGATVILSGRAGIFSGGFDLNELRGTPEQLHNLLQGGAALSLRLLSFPHPVIALCTGHAFPMGAFILMSSDFRIGVAGQYGIGMNEVKIGIAAPRFAMELARFRLTGAHFNRTAILGEMFGPDDARDAGFLDQVVPADQLDAAVAEKITELQSVATLPHQVSKERVRQPLIDLMRQMIDEDLTLENARQSLQRQGRA